MIKIGGRAGFDTLTDLESRFRDITFPIELALPWKYRELWKPLAQRIDTIISFFQKSTFEIFSFHAPQGQISDLEFLEWGDQTIKIAHALNILHITVHPENRKKDRENYQFIAKKQLRLVERKADIPGIFSVETFAGSKRIFRIDEIMEHNLPMTLDTAHIHDQNKILEIITMYHHLIPVVHLSGKNETEHHLPLDRYCIEVVDALKEKKWQGIIILEYLPWHHYRMADDIQALNRYLFHGEPVSIIPPDDTYKNRPDCWGYGA